MMSAASFSWLFLPSEGPLQLEVDLDFKQKCHLKGFRRLQPRISKKGRQFAPFCALWESQNMQVTKWLTATIQATTALQQGRA